MSGAKLLAGVSDDAFLGGAIQVLQPKAGYRAGIDAVLLAASAPAKSGQKERVLDVGAGVGVVGLAVARRVPCTRVTLVENESAVAELARANVERNDLGGRVEVIEADISRRLEDLPELRPKAESFAHVLANPPYNTEGAGTISAEVLRAAANVMPGGNLARWARFMAAMTRPGGSATIVHRADCVGEVLTAFAGRFGNIVVFPLFPYEGKSATRVLVQGIKGSRASLELRPGLVLHEGDGRFRPQVERILREGAPLCLRNDA